MCVGGIYSKGWNVLVYIFLQVSSKLSSGKGVAIKVVLPYGIKSVHPGTLLLGGGAFES